MISLKDANVGITATDVDKQVNAMVANIAKRSNQPNWVVVAIVFAGTFLISRFV